MPISDDFSEFTPGLSSPVFGGFDITPDDGTDLQGVTRAVILGTAGDLAVTLKNGDTITLPNLVAGVIYPFRIARVLATGTTASNIKGLV